MCRSVSNTFQGLPSSVGVAHLLLTLIICFLLEVVFLKIIHLSVGQNGFLEQFKIKVGDNIWC